MDLVISLCRLLANERRLCLHHAVWKQPGISVGSLAEELRLVQPKVSSHLRLMAGFQLLDLRPSGRQVHVHLPPSGLPTTDFVRAVHRLVTRTWTTMADANPTHTNVWDWLGTEEGDEAPAWEHAAARMISCLTAYTHLRRLLLLRCLRHGGLLTQEQLAEGIGMSSSAASRQLLKLTRRGLVESARIADSERYRLVLSPQFGLPRELHRLVMAAL